MKERKKGSFLWNTAYTVSTCESIRRHFSCNNIIELQRSSWSSRRLQQNLWQWKVIGQRWPSAL